MLIDPLRVSTAHDDIDVKSSDAGNMRTID